jgi:glycine/D-amino acid oxidase-like deaminating enzyme
VVGGGIMGLSSALLLAQSGTYEKVVVVSDKFSPNTTSDGAGTWWWLVP